MPSRSPLSLPTTRSSHDRYAPSAFAVRRVPRSSLSHNLSLRSALLMSDYRSPAATTSQYAKEDPNAPVGSSGHSHVATLGHPSDGVVVNESSTQHSTTAHHSHPSAVSHHTTTTTTSAATAAPQVHHTVPSGVTGDGLVVDSNIGGPLSDASVRGARSSASDATTLNPGINIGVSTHQYTAPVGTSGLGGGVGEKGTGMAGVVHGTNPLGQPVTNTHTGVTTHTSTNSSGSTAVGAPVGGGM